MQLKGHHRTSAYVGRAIRTAALIEFEEGCVLVCHGGDQHPIGGSVSPIRDHSGQITGATIVFGGAREESAATPIPSSIGKTDSGGFQMVAESAIMQRLMHFCRRVAASEVSTILLRGESGTGKDVVARLLHYHSRRADQPFLAINCAAIPETLLESELFGYEKGAFTDARAQKKGILEMATGGTAFLDEIGEMSMSLQAKLLRVLENQTIRRLGGTGDIQVDLRVITATNQDLWTAIQQGRFRLDLYYRLNVIQIEVPPLREHREDIIPLANHFIESYNVKFRRSVKGISPEAGEVLMGHDWPGNIRELRNAIERAMVLEDSEWVLPSSLALGPGRVGGAESAGIPQIANAAPGMSLGEAERTMLLNALQRAGWNQTRAAALLSITRDTLRYKMKKFHLRPDGSPKHPA
jgi:transcriptional regulator with PAS, ATPase and Fis domain